MKGWLLLLLCMACSVHAADDLLPTQQAERFLDAIRSGNVDEAYDALLAGSTIPSEQPQQVAALKQKTRTGLPLFGSVLGYELIHEEAIGNSLVRLVYVLKSEKHPTVWEFYFYKPRSGWFLTNIMFNDEFQLLDRKN